MSEPTTRAQAISRALSDIARYQAGAIHAAQDLVGHAHKTITNVDCGAVNDLRMDAEAIGQTATGLAMDVAYARGAAHTLSFLAPYLDVPEVLVERAKRGDELAAVDYRRYERGDWTPEVAA